MIEYHEEPGDTSTKSVTDQIIETVEMLSDSQRKELLKLIHRWLKDSRKYGRIKYETDVVFSGDERLAQGVVVNISSGGLYLQSDRTFAIGQDVTLSFEHPTRKNQIKVSGKIVRSDQKGIGVKFDQPIGNIY